MDRESRRGSEAAGGARAPRPARPATHWLLTWEHEGRTERLPLGRPLRIGRDPGLEVVLADPTVSRAHAVVSLVEGRPVVDASASRNGVVVDGTRVDHIGLAAGQQFAVGTTTFRVVTGAGPARPDSPSAGVGAPCVRRSQDRGWLPFAGVGALGVAVVGVIAGLTLLGGSGATPVDTGGAGIAPPVELVSSDWTPVRLGDSGVALRHPPAWKADQPSDGSAVILRQAGSPSGGPVPTISVSYSPGAAFTPPQAGAGMSAPTSITVAGIQGWEYHQVGIVVPSAAAFIDLPYHGGLVRLTATRGPAVNLVPQLDEIVKTLELAP